MNLKRGVVQVVPIIIVIIIVLGVVAAFVFSGDSASTADAGNPEEVIAVSLQNSFKEGSYVTDTTIVGKISRAPGLSSFEFVDFDLALKAALDFRNEKDPRFSMNLRVNDIGMKESRSSSISHVGPFDLDIRQIGLVQYLRLNEANFGAFFDSSNLIGVWIVMDPNTLASFTGIPSSAGQDKIADQAELIRSLKENVSKINIYNVTEVLAEEDVSGMDSYHYKVEVNKSGINELIAEVMASVKESPEFLKLSSVEKAQVDSQFNSIVRPALEKMEYDFAEIELWISKDKLIPTKTVVTLDAARLGEIIHSLGSSIPKDVLDISGEIVVTSMMSGYGEDQNITAPDGAKPFEQVLQGLFGPVSVEVPIES